MMNRLHCLTGILLLGLLLTSCAPQKRIWYLQDVTPQTPEQIAQNGQIRIKPLDRLTIVVKSQDPELAGPFNLSPTGGSLSAAPSASSGSDAPIYTVDENGRINMPVIGIIDCEGLTRAELADRIARKIVDGGYINDPTVNVRFADMKISVIGEVAQPGVFEIDRDKISIFDALAMAGDLTVYGIRNEVIVARETDGVRTFELLDLTSKEIFNSPAFYLQQNDVVYVKPNKYKAQSGEISQNRSFYLSLVSTALSLATFIITLTK